MAGVYLVKLQIHLSMSNLIIKLNRGQSYRIFHRAQFPCEGNNLKYERKGNVVNCREEGITAERKGLQQRGLRQHCPLLLNLSGWPCKRSCRAVALCS